MTNARLIVCCAANMDKNWKSFAPFFDEKKIRWRFFLDNPKGFLEKIVTRPALAMIRSCWQAVQTVKKERAELLITHDPRATFWCAFFLQWLGIKTRHIAYGFNFPELPTGIKYCVMAHAFKSIGKIIVYSTFEKKLYHDYFNIPLERIDMVLWGVGVPKLEPEEPLESGAYICAIGGNERDYTTLVAAMERLPDIKLVLVVRKQNLKECGTSANVKVLTDIPLGQAMNILKYSRFMILPLKNSKVPCGHVTLVAAMHLGKGFIITNSAGVADYVMDDYNAITCEAQVVGPLVDAIRRLWNDPEKCKQLGENGRRFAKMNCSEMSALEHLKRLLIEAGFSLE